MNAVETRSIHQIGPYQILNEIGRGAMGVVYRAFDPHIGRELAIKTLYVPQLADENQVAEARQRFTLEAQAAGRLSHPNIVVIYQFGQESDYQYIAMELIPGASLDKLMTSRESWTPGEIASIIGQTAAALDFAHGNQVVHRDVKPGNIMLRPDGVVKVTDFGIARVSEQILTSAGAWGTPVYMAPERINGDRGDARADQYALAVVAYQLVANQLPFGKTTDVALLYEILHSEPAALSENRIDRVIRRGLSKDPARRYSSCSEFARDLETAMGAAGPELRTIRTLPPPSVKKQGWAWLWVLLLLLGAGAGSFFYTHGNPGSSANPSLPRSVRNSPAPAPPVRKDPVVIERVKPQRGLWAKFRRAKGVVQFEATIGTDGHVEDLTFISGPGPLVGAAKKAALGWLFQPATLDGQPVEGKATISVDFDENSSRPQPPVLTGR